MSWEEHDQVRLVGLCGKAGAGKDFTQLYLSETWEKATGGTVVRIAFADGVREEVDDYFYEDCESGAVDFWAKPYDEVVRHLLQWWGTDYRRAQDDLYWVKFGMAKVPSVVETYERLLEKGVDMFPLLIVFTDVRFENEAQAIQDAGGQVYEVMAPDEVRALRLGVTPEQLEEQSRHASEVMDFETNGVIMNDSDDYPPRALQQSVAMFLEWTS